MSSELVEHCSQKIVKRITSYMSKKRRTAEEKYRTESIYNSYLGIEKINDLKIDRVKFDVRLRNTYQKFYVGVSFRVSLIHGDTQPMNRIIENTIAWYEISYQVENDIVSHDKERITNALRRSMEQLNSLNKEILTSDINHWVVIRDTLLENSLKSTCKNHNKQSLFTCPCEHCHKYIVSLRRKQNHQVQ